MRGRQIAHQIQQIAVTPTPTRRRLLIALQKSINSDQIEHTISLMGMNLKTSDLLKLIPDEEIPTAMNMLRRIVDEYDKQDEATNT